MTVSDGHPGWSRCLAQVALTIVVLGSPSIALATPSAPGIRDATVYQGGTGVTI